MSHILFHIPHASLKIPNAFWKMCLKDKEYIKKTNIFLSDYMLEKLVPERSNKLVFKYSRLFCDVERYKDDSKEIMFKKGMGVIYTNDCYDTITILTKSYKNKIIKKYYDKYHNKLDKTVTKILNKYNKCTIIDFHSYSDEMVKHLFNVTDTPDICIGTDDFFTNKELVDYTVDHFKKYGYSVKINYPYSGTIIPNKYFNKKDKRINSIMIEINKGVYLNSQIKFYKMKKCIEEYYQNLMNK
jgi:N-formylglutamate amidohydrolase